MDVLLSRTGEPTSPSACWETPPAVFAKLHEEFVFEIDLCADPKRALCEMYFGPGSPLHTDALEAPWEHFGKTVFWINPPYGKMVPTLLCKARVNAAYYGCTTVFLLPMRATRAFHEYILEGATELRFCDKRLTFWENGAPRVNPRTGRPDPAPFDSILVVYRPSHGRIMTPTVSTWHVPAHTSSTPASTGDSHASLSNGPPLPDLAAARSMHRLPSADRPEGGRRPGVLPDVRGTQTRHPSHESRHADRPPPSA